MRVEISGGAAKLSAHGNSVEQRYLTAQTIAEHFYLLAKTSGRSRLAVSLGEHGQILPLFGAGLKMLHKLHKKRTIHMLKSLLDRQGHRSVVDVLRGEAEMDELLEALQPKSVPTLLKEVFNSLDIVVGHRFYRLDALGIGQGEVFIYAAQLGEYVGIDSRELRQGDFAQGDEILDFHNSEKYSSRRSHLPR